MVYVLTEKAAHGLFLYSVLAKPRTFSGLVGALKGAAQLHSSAHRPHCDPFTAGGAGAFRARGAGVARFGPRRGRVEPGCRRSSPRPFEKHRGFARTE